MRDPIQVLFVIFDRIHAVEGKRREKRRAHHRLAQGRDAGRVLVAQQVTAQAGLCALGIFELHDPRPLNGFLAHAEQPGGYLGDHVVGIRDEPLRIAALARASETVKGLGHAGLAQQDADIRGTERHSAAVPGHVDGDLLPGIVAAVEQ